MTKIQYPYIPKGKEIKYATLENEFMQAAKMISDNAVCVKHPSGAVVVKDGKIIGRSSYDGQKKVEECPRWGSPTGTNYEPCIEICGRKHHSEVSAIFDAESKKNNTEGADLYLYGHWWCCEDCWNNMIEAGIENVLLFKNSWNLFNPDINAEMKNWGKPKNT